MKINTEREGVVKSSVLTFKNSTLIYKAATLVAASEYMSVNIDDKLLLCCTSMKK